MSTNLPSRPRLTTGATERVAIVASRYNLRYVQGLVENTTNELYALNPLVKVQLFQVPGAFEIPLMVNEVIRGAIANPTTKWDAVIALGLVIQGSTKHAEFIVSNITTSLLNTSVETRTPVIHEVLLVENEQQAHDRCLGPDLNRGLEAARACLQMIRSLAEARPAVSKTNR